MTGVLGTFSVLAVGGPGIACLALLVRRLATVGTELYWEREWARVEPGWRSGDLPI
jgi:hypothetical protein